MCLYIVCRSRELQTYSIEMIHDMLKLLDLTQGFYFHPCNCSSSSGINFGRPRQSSRSYFTPPHPTIADNGFLNRRLYICVNHFFLLCLLYSAVHSCICCNRLLTYELKVSSHIHTSFTMPSYSRVFSRYISCSRRNKMPLNVSSVYSNQGEFQTFPSRRSVVHSTEGMIACSQPLAARCGLKVLDAGGNAAVGYSTPHFQNLCIDSL